ncbi:unnamed protein product [Symbiodinium sp. KB8]|nr:unnamed protein product [Symbiodinium sp. KB8]
MKKFSFYYVLALATGLIVYSCSKDKDDAPPTTADAPTISSFSPASAAVGEEVTITGKNFVASTTGNVVKFNGTTASVTAATVTQITTSVPSGATTGKITVKVGSNTATSSTDFEVLTGPTAIVLDETELSLKTLDTAKLGITNIGDFGDEEVSWSSDNEAAVLVDDDGNLKAVGGGTATINVAIGDLSVTAVVNVTAASFVVGNENYVGKVWRNGEEFYSFGNGANQEVELYSLYITDTGDIYAAGSIYDSDQEQMSGAIWKNGNLDSYLVGSNVSGDAQAFSIYVSNDGDVLASGYYYDVDDNEIGVVWENGSVLYTLDENEGDATLNAITIDEENGTVYAVGREGNDAILMVGDGTPEAILPDSEFSIANDVFVKDSKVYIVGKEDGNAFSWINDETQTLPKSLSAATAESVFVADNGDVFAVGHETSENARLGILWQNGVIVPATADMEDAILKAIGYANDEVYFAGHLAKVEYEAAYWLGTGEANILVGGNGSDGFAYDIIVK